MRGKLKRGMTAFKRITGRGRTAPRPAKGMPLLRLSAGGAPVDFPAPLLGSIDDFVNLLAHLASIVANGRGAFDDLRFGPARCGIGMGSGEPGSPVTLTFSLTLARRQVAPGASSDSE